MYGFVDNIKVFTYLLHLMNWLGVLWLVQ